MAPIRGPSVAATLLAVGLLLGTVQGAGAEARILEARPARRDGWLVCVLEAADLLDARTRSTVESGLPGVCTYRIEVREEGDGSVGSRTLQLRLRHDIWKGVFVLEGPLGASTFAGLATADSTWAHPAPIALRPLGTLLSDRRYRLLVDVSVDPLLPEDRARLSRYVSRSSGGSRDELSFNLGALLGAFFGSGGGDDRGDHYEGPPFLLQNLPEVP